MTAETIQPETRVADLALANPGTIRIFQQHAIDFCCGGKRPLGEVCAERGIPFTALREELAGALAAPDGSEPDWRARRPASLARYIVARFHGDLRDELPRLEAMAERVLARHGDRHPELLPELAREVRELRREMEAHMDREEQEIFPWINELDRLAGHGQPRVQRAGLLAALDRLEAEHGEAGGALARLRAATAGFTPPEGACATFRGLYHGLAELERDLQRHVHLENNLLFPRVRAMLEEGAPRSAS